ncbi:transporter substrate-binding domain-containing protein [Anderseniella sp. Alg231-50]|uniref:transporter substrate-binding domain-containing protein n=1 Tax=Anderseniella sp. Alg231-50 TaxID=1922226 RepID=UPI000D54DD9E
MVILRSGSNHKWHTRATARFVQGLTAVLVSLVVLAGSPSSHAEPVIKAGVLKFGTVNWLLDVVQHNKLDQREGYRLEQLELARRDATSVALLAGEVDTIVADWFWALRERSAGEKLVFHPYSRTLGALIVKNNSPISTLADLKGRKVGVAGGPLDKSWLLLRAWSRKLQIGDIADIARPVYAAPPLLAEQMRNGDLDAVLIYWHFAAKLEAAGFRQLFGVDEFMHGLGIKNPPPLIGFLFRKPSSPSQQRTFAGFMRSVDAASRLLLDSDAEWSRIRSRMGVKSDAEFETLKQRFRLGRLQGWTPSDTDSSKALFDLLLQTGGARVVGRGVSFDPDVFNAQSSR